MKLGGYQIIFQLERNNDFTIYRAIETSTSGKFLILAFEKVWFTHSIWSEESLRRCTNLQGPFGKGDNLLDSCNTTSEVH
jgi:hypothetical protein